MMAGQRALHTCGGQPHVLLWTCLCHPPALPSPGCCKRSPAKSLTLTSAPSLMSSLMRRASPLMAARCRRVSPRSFLLFTLSLVFEAELGVPFWHTVDWEGCFGVVSTAAKERIGEALLRAEPAGLGLGVSLLCRNLQHLGCLYKGKWLYFVDFNDN